MITDIEIEEAAENHTKDLQDIGGIYQGIAHGSFSAGANWMKEQIQGTWTDEEVAELIKWIGNSPDIIEQNKYPIQWYNTETKETTDKVYVDTDKVLEEYKKQK